MSYREVLLHDVKIDEADGKPSHKCEQGNDHNERHEVAAEPVGKLLDGRLNTRGQQDTVSVK